MRIAIITVSDTRSPANDLSGDTLAALLTADGHTLAERALVRDEVDEIAPLLRHLVESGGVDAVLLTGGTGITGRDRTPEAVRQVLDRDLPGFGELFRAQSVQKIGVAGILSRALAGVAGSTYIFALPGSPGAVRDAWTGILRDLLDAEHRPCNLTELLPRLAE